MIKVGLASSTYPIYAESFRFWLAHELVIYGEGTLEKVGSIFIRIESKSILPPSIVDARRDVSSLQMDLQAASISKLGKIEDSLPVRTVEAGQSVLTELDGLSALKSLYGRLKKLDLEIVTPLIRVIDKLSQVNHISIYRSVPSMMKF